MNPSFRIPHLSAAYASGQTTPGRIIREIHRRIEANYATNDATWTHIPPLDQTLDLLELATARRAAGDILPLYGIPFAIKDNIDLAGHPTTAACPAYAYLPERSATAVAQLVNAGAIPIGKTNLDQFATGLTGVRSPYGAPRSIYSPDHISGGSSSGSAIAVAAGLVSFALGTDTAGSGRVPAAFNNIVGLKPTRGRLSAHGIVPACRSLDCLSIFANDIADALTVFDTLDNGPDPLDPYARPHPAAPHPGIPAAFRFGIPRPHQLTFFGDTQAEALYHAALQRLEALGGAPVEIDFDPFQETARLLYNGPWVAERLAALRDFHATSADKIHPTVRAILDGATKHTAADAFLAQYRLQELRRDVAPVWSNVDLLALPTTGTTYTVAEIEADPIALNTNLGYYTNFANLLDLAAIAVPAGFRPNGLPFGVTFFAPAFSDHALCRFARNYE